MDQNDTQIPPVPVIALTPEEELIKKEEKATALNVSEPERLQEIGSTGTIIVNGILSQTDYNQELTGTDRIRIYDQMRLGDSTVRAGLLAVKLPILSADWYINSDNEEQKQFVEDQLFNNDNFSWNSFLRQAMTFIEYGNAIFEKVFTQLPDGKIGWEKLSPRLSKTILRWTLQDGKTPGITQILPAVNLDRSKGYVREIPKWKLLMFINEQEGSNFEGISMLRAAYKHWYYKDTYYKIDAVATERQGVGVPRVTVPPSASQADKNKVKELARNLRANSAAFIDLPAGFNFEFLDMKGSTIKSPKDMVAHHDRQITKAFLAQFLELGATQAGSFALSANQSELFLLGLQHTAKIVQEEINKAVREVVELNWGKQDEYPTLEFGRIGTVDFERLATALQRLVQGGVIVPDGELEQYIRSTMQLPEAVQTSEDEHEDPKNDKAKTPPSSPSDYQVKKPVRYMVNKESEAKTFGEDLLQLKKDILEAIK